VVKCTAAIFFPTVDYITTKDVISLCEQCEHPDIKLIFSLRLYVDLDITALGDYVVMSLV